jgi:hypothetical protein
MLHVWPTHEEILEYETGPVLVSLNARRQLHQRPQRMHLRDLGQRVAIHLGKERPIGPVQRLLQRAVKAKRALLREAINNGVFGSVCRSTSPSRMRSVVTTLLGRNIPE